MTSEKMTLKGTLTAAFVGAASAAGLILGFKYGDKDTVAPLALLGMMGYLGAMFGGGALYMRDNNYRGLYPTVAGIAFTAFTAVVGANMLASPQAPLPHHLQQQSIQPAPK